MSIKTTVGASSDPARATPVTVYPRELLPTYMCAYVTWMSLCVALSASTDIFGKFVKTCLNFDLYGSSERMAY